MLEFNLMQKSGYLVSAYHFLLSLYMKQRMGFIAYQLGDPTARQLGRLSLDPIKHIDVLGTLIFPAVGYLIGGIIFGWAKPVPVNWSNFHHPKRDMVLVALAGPVANLIMAMSWSALLKLTLLWSPQSVFAIVLHSMSGSRH